MYQQGKVVHFGLVVEDSTREESTPIDDGPNNSTSTSLPPDDVNNSTSTTPPPDCTIVPPLSTWAWIVIGIILTVMLCCFCRCPETLRNVLCCPVMAVLCIACLPVRCCLSCLGFDTVEIKASSPASRFQSFHYGSTTPSGSIFSNVQSFSMR
ncbi:uncharacterized protein [Halyomorpha halys]|uniref:uncharacterized protein isoform X2 n=1 Tax=Halyomorpha halys TaxID=286706 RepID=UPI0006D4FDE1|nr:uncharacterized protein LOC106681376 isoform X2 [Halyomorpha halys]